MESPKGSCSVTFPGCLLIMAMGLAACGSLGVSPGSGGCTSALAGNSMAQSQICIGPRDGTGASPTPSSPPGAAPVGAQGAQFVVYWESGKNDLAQVPQGVTTVIVAFGYLHGHTITNGDITSNEVTASAINALHQRNVKVLLSIGGASPADAFTFDGDVQGFESSLQSVLQQTPYDGIDFDDEGSDVAKRVSDLTALIPATRTFFNSKGMSANLITYPAFNKPGDNNDTAIITNPQVTSALSWINVMSYEGDNASKTESDVAAYGAVFDKARLMLGVDLAGDLGGPPSVSSLGSLASWVKSNGYGGMMIWTSNTATTPQVQAISGGL